MKATELKSPTTPNVKPVNKDNRCAPGKVHKQKEYSSSDDTEDDSDKEEENTSNSEIKKEVYEEDDRNEGDSSTKIENQIAVLKNDNQEQDTPVSSVENAGNAQENELVHQDIQRLKDATLQPKPNVNVQFMLKNGEKVQAKVLSEQPKSTGNWLNIEIVGKEKSNSANWDEVLWWRKMESKQILMLSALKENSLEVLDAKKRELNRLKENNVFNWVEDHGQDSVSCKWVLNGSKMLKGRLVARGFEEKSMNEIIDSPTCSRHALRMVFVSASICLGNYILDINSALLLGNDIEREFLSGLYQK